MNRLDSRFFSSLLFKLVLYFFLVPSFSSVYADKLEPITDLMFQAEALTSFEKEDMESEHRNPSIHLSNQFSVFGPFAAGMRELPFGANPLFSFANLQDLLEFHQGSSNASSPAFPSVYGYENGKVSPRIFKSTERKPKYHSNGDESKAVGQTLEISYPEVDFQLVAHTAGWSSKQWQSLAISTLEIHSEREDIYEEVLCSFVLDRGSEFALIRSDLSGGPDLDNVRWYNGDWYSYNSQFAAPPPDIIGEKGRSSSSAPFPHLIRLEVGRYFLVLRAAYEIRIFGDPDSSPNRTPTVQIDIDVEIVRERKEQETGNLQKRLSGPFPDPEPLSARILDQSPPIIVPDLLAGWFAGGFLRVGLRNEGLGWIEVVDVKALDLDDQLEVSLQEPVIRIAPHQTRLVSLKLSQRARLPSLQHLQIELVLQKADIGGRQMFRTDLIPVRSRPAFWSPKNEERASSEVAFTMTQLNKDGTVDYASIIPPRKSWESVSNGARPPVVLALHGAGVETKDEWWTGSIRRQNYSWIVMPSGRTSWGYDWQLASLHSSDTSIRSLLGLIKDLSSSTGLESLSDWTFDASKLFVIGHSNGGQGAWYRMSHYPDSVIGGVVAAGYIKVSDYVQFDWHVSRHYTDPSLDSLLHSSLSMFENDLYTSNLVGIPLLIKYGSKDDNVPPWHSRDMFQLIESWNRKSGYRDLVDLTEVPEAGHWWDGILSEQDVQASMDRALSKPDWSIPSPPETFTLTTANPEESGSEFGWRIKEIEIPGRLARLDVRYFDQTSSNSSASKRAVVKTRNTKSIEIQSASLRNLSDLSIDGYPVSLEPKLDSTESISLTRNSERKWNIVNRAEVSKSRPRPIGPLIRFLDSPAPLLLVVPSRCSESIQSSFLEVARGFATDSLLYGRLDSEILLDGDATRRLREGGFGSGNVLILGSPEINLLAEELFLTGEARPPIEYLGAGQFQIKDRIFSDTALLSLWPHPVSSSSLALLVHAPSPKLLSIAVRLLPVRTGTMVPEWIALTEEAEGKGVGSAVGLGWWKNDWSFSESMSWIDD